MAMYPATPIKIRGLSYSIGSDVPVARSTFHSLLMDSYIVAADKFYHDYILTDKGKDEAKKAFVKRNPAQQEMIVIPYRYCYNSYGVDPVLQIRVPFVGDHVPSMDGYWPGDKLTLAYEGEIAVPATKDGCETLFRLFNAPFARPDEYAGPSMSIGDVVTFCLGTENEISFACDTVGFVAADISTSKIEPRPDRWIRSGEKLRQYLLMKEEETGIPQGV